MKSFLHNYYDIALEILQFLGGTPGEYGLGYQLINLMLFACIQPGLAFLFFFLWRRQRRTNTQVKSYQIGMKTDC